MKTSTDIETIQNILAKADPLYTEREVSQAVEDVASAVYAQLYDKYPVCLSVMVGGLVFAGQLLPRLNCPVEIDYIHVSRYQGMTRGSHLQWIKLPSLSLEGRTVLVIDDILDEGLTLKAIAEHCFEKGAREVRTAVLVEKQLSSRPGLARADFTGLLVPNRYVFGFGMDYQGQLRNVPGIYAVHGL